MRSPGELSRSRRHDTLQELDETFRSWSEAESDDERGGYDPELDDGRSRLRDGELLEADEPPGEYGRRLASGTGQFNLRGAGAPDLGADAPISTIMTRKVAAVRADTDVSEARARMLERGVSGLPVVNNWGRAIGVISKTDLVEHEVTGERGRATVGDLMMPLVFALPPDSSISHAAALMAFEGVHRIIVVDRGGYLVGLVSTMDVVRWIGAGFGIASGT
jgi:CBS domain-containing protein